MAKLLNIATIVLAAITALLGFINLNTVNEARSNLGNAQTELASTKKSLDETNTKLGESQKSAAEWTTKIEAAEGQVTILKAESESKDSKIQELQSQISTKEMEIELEKSKANTAVEEAEELKKKVEELNPEQEKNLQISLDEQVTINKQLEKEKEDAQSRLKALEESLALKNKDQKVKSLSGRILAVNEAWNFVVLNVGDKNGLSSNAELLVKRGNTRIGRVRITSVEPASSIADIIPGSLVGGLSIQPGDYVVSDYVTN